MATLIKPQEVVNTGVVRAAPVTARFDVTLISPHIYDAEERFLIPYLTQDLYDAMVTAQNAAVSNYNSDVGPIVLKFTSDPLYETLWTKYVLRLNSRAVLYQSLPYINTPITSQGVVVNDTEYSNNAGLSTMKFLQDAEMANIERIQELLREYLCDNKTDYPLFDDKDCPCEDTLCDDGCGNNCTCGYYSKYGTWCPNCKTHKDNNTGIIFY